jgi:hypothetical protein
MRPPQPGTRSLAWRQRSGKIGTVQAPIVLTREDLDAFIADGYCTLRAAFPAEQAAAARACIWQRMRATKNIRQEDAATWPPVCDIEEVVGVPEVTACVTDRLASAIEDLLGAGRWLGERRWGFWPVNFAFGRGEPYAIPNFGWHVDGNWFRHTLDCPKQGLLLLGLFSDIAERGGGTIVAAGSHRLTARVLADHPEGLTHRALFDAVLREPLGNFRELTGRAGDVVLAHPMLFHTRGLKHTGEPRFMSNCEAPLKEPLQLRRTDPSEFSVLEKSIIAGIEGPPPLMHGAMQCYF